MGKRGREKGRKATNIPKKRQAVTTTTQDTSYQAGGAGMGNVHPILSDQETFEARSSLRISDEKASAEREAGTDLSWKEHIVFIGIGAGIAIVVYLISFLV